ncbi:hypothetical protein G7Y89_g52 [Cudoniella acicularis]|uniref:Xylanolytic transcriptional activator regulatory domain-containing protein n=1 Tax=Cudoniella acicularis TaxID=354080 RepID=A0A8H4WAR9_9HELO|nr:hypothetical protein G7Y89_g52 [Cudoniella acicularis]
MLQILLCVREAEKPDLTLNQAERFPERELLERLRHYEGLLRKNNIKFEPLHKHTSTAVAAAELTSLSEDGRSSESVDDAHSKVSKGGREPREEMTVKSKTVYEAESRFPDSTYLWMRDFWHAISQICFLQDTSNDDMRDAVIKHAWDITYQSESNDHLLLWQIYLENVNPLLKVTHTPTLQARIIDAACDMENISPILEALMFSIYCVSILSLTEDECYTLFGSPRKDLLASYQFACQQALLNCRAWRSGDRDCLTALYLYLVSVRPETDPRSLSSMLAVAIRTAQRMGIHDESTYVRYTTLEAEMRRRLWWSLVIFDNRVCEMLDYKTATLAPTWDCRTPLNVDDSEIRPEMKTSPAIHEKPTEAIFAVVRSELGDFVRHSAFHSNIIARAKDTRHGPVQEGSELMTLEKTIEDKYLTFCDPENSLHFITIWTTRGYLAKSRLMEHYSKYSTSTTQQTDTQRNAAISYALSMLECDMKLMASPLTKGYLWLIHFDFPFLAYVHILQDLRERPTVDHSQKAWDSMSDNYSARVKNSKQGQPIFIVFSRVVLQAWEMREALSRQQDNDRPLEPPRIVSDMKNKLAQMRSDFEQHRSNIEQQPDAGVASINIDESLTPMPVEFGQYLTGPGPDNDISGQAFMDVDMNQFWTAIDWNWMQTQD